MYRLPLFPLPVVLFPGTVMHLHIFEPRYRAMIAHCRENECPFGLLFHDPDQLGPFLSDPGRIGCVAHIEKYRGLEDGRSLILVRGGRRFRIQDGIESEAPYYEAVVEDFDDHARSAGNGIVERRQHTLALFHRLVEALPGQSGELPQCDTDRDLSFLLAQVIQIDPSWQQSLLQLRDEGLRLERVDAVFSAVLDGEPEVTE